MLRGPGAGGLKTRSAAPVALAAVVAVLASACATRAPAPADAAATADPRCAMLVADFDAAVTRANVRDAETATVDGFPWLRVDRFLSSFREAPLSAAATAAWVGRMASRASAARRVEAANLPDADLRAVAGANAAAGADDVAAKLAACGQAQALRDLASPERLAQLRVAAVVPDSYDDALRVAGAYPLTALAASFGIRRYEAQTRAAFAVPQEALPLKGALRTYARAPGPAAPTLRAADVERVLLRAYEHADALGVPALTDDDAQALLATYAPVYVVDEASADDRIGAPVLDAAGAPRIDTTTPVVYTRVAYTRFGGEVLVQLVYAAWFPARTAASSTDVLAGALDALVWRVTLDRSGAPLAFDSMHACGCYDMFFPTARLALRPQPPTIDELALVPQALDALAPATPVTLRVEAGTHYLRRVITVAPAATADRVYALAPDAALTTLPLPGGGTHSLYGEDGLVRASERPERYLFWPLGIPSAGAMRQWGHHATAFVGRRHFDEPFLLDRYFAKSRR